MANLFDITSIKTKLINDINFQHSNNPNIKLGLLIPYRIDEDGKKYIKSISKQCSNFGVTVSIIYYSVGNEIESNFKYIRDIVSKSHNDTGFIPINSSNVDNNIIFSIHNILSEYDVDIEGINSKNFFALSNGKKCIIPCTTKAIMDIIRFQYGDNLSGKNVMIIGRSHRIGKSLLHLLINNNTTITLCHSKTNMETITYHLENDDIIITAIDKPEYFYTNGKEYQLFVDAGICAVDNSVRGNLNKHMYTNSLGTITTVPNGVGILTTLELLNNLYESFSNEKINAV